MRDFPAATVEGFKKHLAKRPGDAVAQFRMAENLRALGRVSEARTVLEGLKNVPSKKLWFVHLCWGELHMDTGDYQSAEYHFRQAAELHGHSTVAWVYLGGCLGKQEKFVEACQALENGLNSKGDRDEVFLNLGYQKRAMGDYDGAYECFKSACSLNRHYPEARVALEDISFLRRMTKGSTKRPHRKNERRG
jgi:Flp pilus assembly protein TadD